LGTPARRWRVRHWGKDGRAVQDLSPLSGLRPSAAVFHPETIHVESEAVLFAFLIQSIVIGVIGMRPEG
jgi:hypothetical protein